MMFDMDSPNRRGVLLALSAGFLWGFPGILVKSIEGFSFLGLATLRMFLAFLMIAAGILIFKKGGELVASFRYWKFWILLGLLMSFRWAWGMAGFQYTLVANASLFGNTTPLFLLFLGPLFLGESLRKQEIIFMAVTFVGIFLMIDGKGFSWDNLQFRGDMFSILGAFSFAIYSIIVRKKRALFPFYIMMFWLFLISSLFMVLGGWLFEIPFTIGPIPSISWFYLLILVIFPTVAAHSAYNFSLSFLRSDQAATIILIGPLFAAFLGYLFLEEKLPSQSILGMVLVLCGIYGIIAFHSNSLRFSWDRLKSLFKISH